jgi:type II secretory pathway pseudopilin PulG
MELLMVIAIITILASLLLVAISAAQGKARRTVCAGHLRQINVGVRMYSDDANDKSPKPASRVSNPYSAYKELMKSYVGLRGQSSAQDKIFACPADTFYFDYLFPRRPPGPTNLVGYVAESLCSRPDMDYSSYLLNGGNLFPGTNGAGFRPGIAGLSLSSIRHPARTVLVAEVPAFIPFSWHKPKRPLYILSTSYCPNLIFNNAMNMASFVDGHVGYTRIYWNGGHGPMGVACNYDPPAPYDYQWSEQ